jgi:hypothetical protein
MGLLVASAGQALAMQAPAAPTPAAPPQLAAAACEASSASGAELEQRGRDRAQVLCASVERVANHAIRVRSECRLQAGAWACEPRGKEMQLGINGREVTIGFPLEMNSWSAYRMVHAIGPMAVPQALPAPHHPRDREEHCALVGDDSDPQVARMALRCDLWMVEFVKLCSAAGCRYEPAERRGSDAQRPRDGKRPPGEPRPAG